MGIGNEWAGGFLFCSPQSTNTNTHTNRHKIFKRMREKEKVKCKKGPKGTREANKRPITPDTGGLVEFPQSATRHRPE